MGKSEKEEQATRLNNDLRGFNREISGTNFQVDNPFKDYKTPFDYNSIANELERLYGISLNEVDRTANDAIGGVQKNTASRLASQGITGGSVLNSQVNAGTNEVNKSRLASKTALLKNKAGNNLSAMDMENRNKFQTTAAKGNFDLENMANLFRKFGLLSGNYGQQQGNLGNLDSTTWFDDILAVANTGAGFINPLDDLFSGGAGKGN